MTQKIATELSKKSQSTIAQVASLWTPLGHPPLKVYFAHLHHREGRSRFKAERARLIGFGARLCSVANVGASSRRFKHPCCMHRGQPEKVSQAHLLHEENNSFRIRILLLFLAFVLHDRGKWARRRRRARCGSTAPSHHRGDTRLPCQGKTSGGVGIYHHFPRHALSSGIACFVRILLLVAVSDHTVASAFLCRFLLVNSTIGADIQFLSTHNTLLTVILHTCIG